MNELRLEYPSYDKPIKKKRSALRVSLIVLGFVYGFFAWWTAVLVSGIFFVRYMVRLSKQKVVPFVVKVVFMITALIGQLIAVNIMTGSTLWSINYAIPIGVNMISLAIIIYSFSKGRHWKLLIPIQFLSLCLMIFLYFSHLEVYLPLVSSSIIMLGMSYGIFVFKYGKVFIKEMRKYLHI